MTLLMACALGATLLTQSPPVLIDSLAGRDSFERYCAGCHGSDGRGGGPVAAELRTRPADLTLVARRNNGAFPRDRVRDFITGTGRPLPAHGTIEMPVWGPMFRAFESDARVRERIANLVGYIETLQRSSTAGDDEGSRLFRAHCAGCHGADARGHGPEAGRLRRGPPDLTQFAARNGGMFPRERVYRIIDGRDVPAHGDRDMPIWGQVFGARPGGSDAAAAVKARIDAIVRYLEGIQERAG
ncbi:MAG: c-type cytochrome [Acidobacteria bacterium]|nr:c-type cytochrome [Acidobacteriota bacterium]